MLPLALKKYDWVINLILIIAISYVSARILNDALSKAIYSPSANIYPGGLVKSVNVVNTKTRHQNRSYYDTILRSSVFGTGNTSKNSSYIQNVPETELNLRLIGTYIKVNGNSIAIIKNINDGKIDSYTHGDVIDVIKTEKTKLLEIDNCKVIVGRETKGRETLLCNKKISLKRSDTVATKTNYASKNIDQKGIKKVSKNQWLIEKKMLDELLDDPSKLITQATAVPNQNGMRFVRVKPNGIFFKIGIRSGDTIHTINDVELNNMKNAWNLLESLKNESEFTINLTRKGSKFSYSYEVN